MMREADRRGKCAIAVFLALILCLVPVQSVQARSKGMDLSSLLGGGSLTDLLGGLDTESLGGASGILEILGMLSTHAIKDCTIAPIPDKTYTGEEIKPTLNITYDGTRLRKGTDYTVTFTNNVKVGTAKCKITGKGNYTGTKTVSFKIVKSTSGKDGSSSGNSSKSGSKSDSKNGSKSGSKTDSRSGSKSGSKTGSDSQTSKKFTVRVSSASVTYTGTARKPSVKVTVSGKTIAKTNYTVTYKDNKNVGKATVTVKGKGDYKNYTGEATFKITMKKTALSGASSPEEASIKCSWKKDSQADGYQLEYCTNKTFSKTAKTVRVAGGAETSYTITKLTSGKNYYVRIRAYKKVGNSNWYSEWSAAKSVKVK